MKRQRRSWRFLVLDRIGSWTYSFGHWLYDVGLELCGLAGTIDGKADNYR